MPSFENVDIQAFDARLHGLMLPMGLRLDLVSLKGIGLHLVRKPFAMSVDQPGTLEVAVGEESLAAFLENESPGGLHGFSVKLGDGQVVIQASKKLIVDVPVRAVCTLRIVEKKELHVDLVSVDVLGAGATNLVQSQLENLNPVINAADLPVPAEITDVTIVTGAILLRGTVLPPDSFD